MEITPMKRAYDAVQWGLDKLLSPNPPPPNATLGRPKIAIIGAGLTGVSAAAHCVGHGFEVQLFEAGDEGSLGGIWARVNKTSGLQIHSVMYRFHPSIKWSEGYPDRHQIVSQITELWKRYRLKERTKFNTRVRSVRQNEKGKWVVNGDTSEHFEGIIAAIGSCGENKMPRMPNQGAFKGEIYHSSKLDGRTAEGKKVLIIGGGASAVEGLEFCVHTGASTTSVLARSEKWIIPRNALVDSILALNIFGQQTMFSWVPESLLRLFFYRDLQDLAPPQGGLFTETPMVNSDVFHRIRQHKAKWLRGDILGFTENGVRINRRAQGVPKGGPGHEVEVKGDMVIMATGYERPSLNFLPDECFTEPYVPPSWYLQVFPPEHMSIAGINCTYVNAIGTVGNYHIGIYTRLMLMFLVDPLAAPQEYWMKRWIDFTEAIKSRAPTGAFDFFTYSELLYWFVFCIVINPFRWKWAFFVFFGVGRALPMTVVNQEDHLRNGLGMRVRSH